jgi:hypothetical protein
VASQSESGKSFNAVDEHHRYLAALTGEHIITLFK